MFGCGFFVEGKEAFESSRRTNQLIVGVTSCHIIF